MRDYYDLLGVDRDADVETIEAAFRECIRERHPDRDGTDSTEEVVQLKRAREVLTDPALRKDYDRLGHREFVERERGAGSESVDLRSSEEETVETDPARSHTRPRQDRTTRSDDPSRSGARRRTDQHDPEPSDAEQTAEVDEGMFSGSGGDQTDVDPTDAIDFGEPTSPAPDDEPTDTEPGEAGSDVTDSRPVDRERAPTADDELDAVVDIDDLMNETDVGSVDPDEILGDDDEFADVAGEEPPQTDEPDSADEFAATDSTGQSGADSAGDDPSQPSTAQEDGHSSPPDETGAVGAGADETDQPAVEFGSTGAGSSPTGDDPSTEHAASGTADSDVADDRGTTAGKDESTEQHPTDTGFEADETEPTPDTTSEQDTGSDPAAFGSSGESTPDDSTTTPADAGTNQQDPLADPAEDTADATPESPAGNAGHDDSPGAPLDADQTPATGDDSGQGDPLAGPGSGTAETSNTPQEDTWKPPSTESGPSAEQDSPPTEAGTGESFGAPEQQGADPMAAATDRHDAGGTERMDHGSATTGGQSSTETPAGGDPLAGPDGEPSAESADEAEYAGTDGGIERAAPGAVPAEDPEDGGGPGIVATIVAVPKRLVGALVAVPVAVLGWLAALPRRALGAIPTFGIPAAIGEVRVLLGAEWYSDEVAVMARYAWLGRLALAAVVWLIATLVVPGATLVPTATIGSLSAVVVAVLLSHVGYDLLLSLGTDVEPGCHGNAAVDPPLRGVALLVATYAGGVGLAVGAIWRTEALSAPLLGRRPIGALPDGVVSAPEPALAAAAGLLVVVVSLLGLLSAALTLPWSDRYDHHYHVLPGLWQAPLSTVVGGLAWTALTGGPVPLLGQEYGLVHVGIAAGCLPIVAAIYLLRRGLESPDPQPAW